MATDRTNTWSLGESCLWYSPNSATDHIWSLGEGFILDEYPEAIPTPRATSIVKLAMAFSDKNTPTYSFPQSRYINAAKLTAGVEATISVPDGAKHVIFSRLSNDGSTPSVYIKINGTASIPAADISDGSAPEINPYTRSVAKASTISLISPVDCIVTLSFFR